MVAELARPAYFTASKILITLCESRWDISGEGFGWKSMMLKIGNASRHSKWSGGICLHKRVRPQRY